MRVKNCWPLYIGTVDRAGHVFEFEFVRDRRGESEENGGVGVVWAWWGELAASLQSSSFAAMLLKMAVHIYKCT